MAAELEHPERVVGLPLLQPGRGPAAAGDRPGRADRRRLAGHRVRGRQGAEEVLRAGQGRAGVRGQPAADPVPGRGHPPRRRGHAVRGRRRARSSRSACRCRRSCCCSWSGPAVALHVAETLHAAFPDRFAVSENLRRVVEAGKSGCLRLGRRDAADRPRRGAAARRRRRAVHRRAGPRAGRWTRWPRRSGSCSTRASSPRPRTSTCA